MFDIPRSFASRMAQMHGEKGRKWLDALHDNVVWAEERWKLKVLSPFALSYNFVAPVIFHNQAEAVLKICISEKEWDAETKTLGYYDGVNMCRLLDHDAHRKILLLEMLRPGSKLTSVTDESAAIRIAAALIKAMKARNGNRSLVSFPQISDWATGVANLRKHYHGTSGPFPEMIVRTVESLFPGLISTQKNTYLLHGDFHHGNVLRSSGGWKLIDPKGVMGEMEYELIPFLMNNLPDKSWKEVIDNRIVLFSEQLDIRPHRTYAWGVCHALLSAWWNIEDQLGISDKDLAMLEYFYSKCRPIGQ